MRPPPALLAAAEQECFLRQPRRISEKILAARRPFEMGVELHNYCAKSQILYSFSKIEEIITRYSQGFSQFC